MGTYHYFCIKMDFYKYYDETFKNILLLLHIYYQL